MSCLKCLEHHHDSLLAACFFRLCDTYLRVCHTVLCVNCYMCTLKLVQVQQLATGLARPQCISHTVLEQILEQQTREGLARLQ